MIFMTYHSSLMSPLTYLRLFTHVFGHDGWQHFIKRTGKAGDSGEDFDNGLFDIQ